MIGPLLNALEKSLKVSTSGNAENLSQENRHTDRGRNHTVDFMLLLISRVMDTVQAMFKF